MKPLSIMVIAGEPSGDTLAAELVEALRARLATEGAGSTRDAQPLRTSLAPRFFGAGGPRMAAAGVEVVLDLATRSVIGPVDVARNYRFFHRAFWSLWDWSRVVVCSAPACRCTTRRPRSIACWSPWSNSRVLTEPRQGFRD